MMIERSIAGTTGAGRAVLAVVVPPVLPVPPFLPVPPVRCPARLLENPQRLLCGAPPAVLREDRRRGREHSGARLGIEQRALERRGGRLEIAALNVERRIAARLTSNRRIEKYGRHAGSKGLDRRQAKAFVFRQERERARAAVHPLQLRVRDVGVPARTP